MEQEDVSKTEVTADSTSTNLLTESFETWTVLSGIGDNKLTELNSVPSKEDNEAESLEEDSDVIKDVIDDFSDGISIISDSESTDRCTPQPISSSLSGTTDSVGDTVTLGSEVHEVPPLILRKEESEVRKNHKKEIVPTQDGVVAHNLFQHIYELRKTIFFYLSVFVAVIAFIGKLKCLEWNQLPLSSEISPLTQRVDDLELQNNLLRAEIDLLAKQINYINQKKEKLKYKMDERKSLKKGENNIKGSPHWILEDPINGEGEGSMETGFANLPFNHYYIKSEEKILPQNKITKDNQHEIKKTAGSSTQNENSLHENTLPTTPFVKGTSQVPNQYPEDSIFNEHEVMGAKGVAYKTQYDENVKQYNKEIPNMDAELHYRENVYELKYPRSPENGQHKDFRKDDKSSEFKGKEYDKNAEFKKKDKKGENYHKKWQKKERDKPYIKDSSGEGHRHYTGEDRKKIYQKYSQQNQDWHENLMKSREDFRKKQGKHSESNWYIERANSREQARLRK